VAIAEGAIAHVTFDQDRVDHLEVQLPAGSDAALTSAWGPGPHVDGGREQWWFDATTRWDAVYDPEDLYRAPELRFSNPLPDPDMMAKGDRVLDHALHVLTAPDTPTPEELLEAGYHSNPFGVYAVRAGHDVRVLVSMPMSHDDQLSSWLEILDRRWGAPRNTTPRKWSYAAAGVQVDAQFGPSGGLELMIARPHP
jgi:hypothetical protein